MKATIRGKGRLTIPVALRRKLNLHAGTVLEFDEQVYHLQARKVIDRKQMKSVIGIGKRELEGRTALEWLDDLREPVALPPRQTRKKDNHISMQDKTTI